MNKKLDKLLNESKIIKIDDNSKFVIMSDCHRGDGTNSDNFIKNKNIYKAALNYYYNNEFSYIELGDGDEMWEVKNYQEIIDEHLGTFKLLGKFNDSKRLYMVYGNHDKCKKYDSILQKYFYKYYNKATKQEEPLLDNLIIYESLVLNYQNNSIFMLHGHQVDFLNNTLWKLARFLVRYIWKSLEFIGIKDPTSAAKNHNVTKRIEKKLRKWSIKNNKILISGHTHRPIFPICSKSLYFNAGSCIHPSGITCLEIKNGSISLVKWVYNVRDDNLIYVDKEILAESIPINNFFN